MKKYRLKQWYPGLPEEWKRREVIIELTENSCVYPSALSVDQYELLDMLVQQVENTEYWEELPEYNPNPKQPIKSILELGKKKCLIERTGAHVSELIETEKLIDELNELLHGREIDDTDKSNDSSNYAIAVLENKVIKINNDILKWSDSVHANGIISGLQQKKNQLINAINKLK